MLVAKRGSQADTYRELFIHRTTLTYRLERIVELTGIDLQDPQTWLHLALSYALE